MKYCVPSSFSYTCIDSFIHSDFSKCRLLVYIAIIILAICYNIVGFTIIPYLQYIQTDDKNEVISG